MTAGPGGQPADRGLRFPIGKQTRHAINVAAIVAVFLAVACFVGVIGSFAGDDSTPVGGVIAFALLGLFFGALGVLFVGGSISDRRNTGRWGDHELLVDQAGFHDVGNPSGDIFVPWSELAGLDVVASDYGGGYNRFSWVSFRNAKSSLGVMTGLRMYPVHPDEFARRIPEFVTSTQPTMQQRIIAGPFGKAYYSESDIRADLLAAINYYTHNRLGRPVDETARARVWGSQFGQPGR